MASAGGPAANPLSIFRKHVCSLDGQVFYSVFGFLLGIKYRPGDMFKEEAFKVAAPVDVTTLTRGFTPRQVFWRNREIPYGSCEHRDLIRRAVEARFADDPAARAYLQRRDDKDLQELAREEARYFPAFRFFDEKLQLEVVIEPADAFCEMLAGIRER